MSKIDSNGYTQKDYENEFKNTFIKLGNALILLENSLDSNDQVVKNNFPLLKNVINVTPSLGIYFFKIRFEPPLSDASANCNSLSACIHIEFVIKKVKRCVLIIFIIIGLYGKNCKIKLFCFSRWNS